MMKTICLLFVCFAVTSVNAQTYLESFGQNRVQHRKFRWQFFDTKHLRVYHYDAAGRQLARYVAEQAEKDIKMIEHKMGGEFPHRFNIILYNDYDDYRQTNIGRKDESQIQDIPAGTVDLVGDRLVVYFTGVHTDLRKQLRSGMSRVVMERLIFGESFREMVKNALLLNLPQWTTDGFIAYLVDGWDTESETDWKNLIQANPTQGFYELAEKKPELAGKAFWKYISEKYGEQAVKNLLSAMQQKSSLNQGIKITLGQTLKQTYQSVLDFYNETYAQDALVQEAPDSMGKAILEIPVPTDNSVIRQIKVAPKGFDVAYVVWKEGEYKVIIQHTKDEQEKAVVISGGLHNHNETQADPNYPLIAWSNTGFKLGVLYKKGTQTRLRIYNSIKAKLEDYIIPANRFDRVLGMCFMEDDDNLVFAAVRKSQTDLYEFKIKGSKLTAITHDAWDDVQPSFISGGFKKGVLFLSNRPEPNLNVPIAVNQLPTGKMNVFFFDTKTRRSELLQCSDITKGTISEPIQYGSENFAYLYDSNGIINKYVVLFARDVNNMDSAYAVPITNYTQSILGHQYNPASNQIADVVQVGDRYKVYFKPLELPGVNAEVKQLYPTRLSRETSTTSLNNKTSVQPQKILNEGNVFQSEFVEEKTEDPIQTTSSYDMDDLSDVKPEDIDSIMVDSTYVKLRAQRYRLSFKPDFFTVRIDNSVLFTKYQSTNYNGGQYSNPSLGGMVSVSLNDMMENHKFTGGLRLPVNFSGLSYFFQYENFERRVDWGLLFLRTENSYRYSVDYTDSAGNVILPNHLEIGKLTTNMIQGSASYPLDKVKSFRFHLGLRQDVLDFKAQDTISLTFSERSKEYWAMSRMEYVYDDTRAPALNIMDGLRFKLFAEYLYQLSKPNDGLYNLGFDFRYYRPIYKNIIVAARSAFAHSAGDKRINYIMGGVDNWIGSQSTPLAPPPSENFVFQTLATNMRGYKQNSRNGNTYGLINAELRAPVFTTFIKKPIQSAFIKNFQIVGFIDVGSAWNGLLPTKENLDKTYTFYNPPPPQSSLVSLSVKLPNTGLAMGYGTGIRTMLFGYFMRLDAAWSIEGIKKPMWHFSIGTDF